VADGAATFGGTDGQVKLPNDVMFEMGAITVSAQVWIDPAQTTPYWIWGWATRPPGW